MRKISCFVFVLLLVIGETVCLAAPPSQKTALSEIVYSESVGIAPLGGTIVDIVQENISYAWKTEREYVDSYKLPGYVSDYSCGITAGGNIIAYYDRLYENLIPNHSGSIFLGKYRYANQGSEVSAMFGELYTAMNATPVGVTLNGYLNGISSYAASKSRAAAHSRAMLTANAIDTDKVIAAFSEGKMVTLFLTGFSVIDFYDFKNYTGYDTIKVYLGEGAHIMAAYGYYEVSYYDASNNLFRKDSYMLVVSGFAHPSLCFVRLNDYCVIQDCYITNIY